MAFYASQMNKAINESEHCQLSMPPIGISSEDSGSISDYDYETRNFRDNCAVSRDMSMSDSSSNFGFSEKSSADNLSLSKRMSLFDPDEGDLVPPLDIRSEMNFSVGNPLTYKTKRKFETAKIVLEPNKNVEEWLARKRQRQLDAIAKQKREEEEKRQQAEERKRLAEEKYQKWLELKKTNSTGALSNRKVAAAPAAPAPKSTKSSVETSATEKKKKLEEWMRKKQKQESERRLREQRTKEERAKQEAARKQRNNGAHEKWLERNKNAPKPVPLNQGLATLRGTVSKIYINPNEWRFD